MYDKEYTMVFAPRLLNRLFSECIVKSLDEFFLWSEISSLEDISTKSRHLDDENIKKLSLI